MLCFDTQIYLGIEGMCLQMVLKTCVLMSGSLCYQVKFSEANMMESFRKLRDVNKLFSVTLATDDGKQIEAHKMILLCRNPTIIGTVILLKQLSQSVTTKS